MNIILIYNLNEYFNNKNNKNDKNNKKYLKIIPYDNAGLSHQTSNLYAIIREGYYRKMIIILPIFTLNKIHNNGIEIKDNLSKYYNYDKLKVNNEKIHVIEDDSHIPDNEKETIHIKDMLISTSKKLIA